MSYFTTKQREDGSWIFVDAQGSPFYSLGVNCFSANRVAYGELSKPEKYGKGDWFPRWAEEKMSEVYGLGFNTMGAWAAKYYYQKQTPKTIEIRCSRTAKTVNNGWGGYGFPDVFDPSFESATYHEMMEMFHNSGLDLVEDPTLIGYYTDNELHWWGSGGLWGDDNPGENLNEAALVEDYIRQNGDVPGKIAWVDHLRKQHGTIEKLNEAWQAEYENFEELLWLKQYRTVPEVYEQDKLAFLREIAEIYFKTTSEMLKMFDPNHLNLGCRLVGTSTPKTVLEVMGKYVDVVSLNFYSFGLPEAWLEQAYKITGKPMMVTEFSFCVGTNAGFDLVTNGAQLAHVRTQKRRGEAYHDFVTQAFNLPYMIGTHWFALYDFHHRQGLIGNYGLYDGKDQLWSEFAEAVKETHDTLKW